MKSHLSTHKNLYSTIGIHRNPKLSVEQGVQVFLFEMNRGWNKQNILNRSPSLTQFSWLQGTFHAISLELRPRSCQYLLEIHPISALQLSHSLTRWWAWTFLNKCLLYLSISPVALWCGLSHSLLIPNIRRFWPMDPKHCIYSPFIKYLFVKLITK